MPLDLAMDFIPHAPVISRFVAPWDTSGWYYVAPDLSIGKHVYSNTSEIITELPGEYFGADQIVVFDSAAENFDDKQELDFFVECDAQVFIAADMDALSALPIGIAPTGRKLRLSSGREYAIASFSFDSGTQVHIPGFTGPGHHWIVFALPQHRQSSQDRLPSCPQVEALPTRAPRALNWQMQELFRTQILGQPPQGFDLTQGCEVVEAEQKDGSRVLHMGMGASIEQQVCTSGRDLVELCFSINSGELQIHHAGLVVSASRGQVVLDGTVLVRFGQEADLILRLERFPETNTCEVWVNARPAAVVPCTFRPVDRLRIRSEGEILIERITLRDVFEAPILSQHFSEIPSGIVCSDRADAHISPTTALGSVLSLSDSRASFGFPLPEMRSDFRLELTAKPSSEAMTVLPALLGPTGQPVLRVAFFHNSLYVTDGQRWTRIYGGDTPFQYFPADNWYRISLQVRLSKGCYDLMVDGAVRGRGLALAHPVKAVSAWGVSCISGEVEIQKLQLWDAADLSRGMLPPGPVIDVTRPPFGAVGDGHADCTQALQATIDAAAQVGGTVLVRDGVYYTGGLTLVSGITLWVDETATLRAIQDHSCFPLREPSESLCAVRQLGRSLLYGEHLRQVQILGGGTLDANGLYRFKMNDPKIDKERNARPDHIYIACSKDVTISDLHLVNAAYWSVVPLSCRFVLMQHLNLDCMNTPNRDGIDPVDCTDLTVRDCAILAGDDGLCFKSSDKGGCRNLLVEDLIIQSLASGIKFGTDSYGALKDVTIRRVILKNVNRCGLAFETVDGAEIENLLCCDIDMVDCGGPIYLVVGERNRHPSVLPDKQPQMNKLTFERISYRKAYPFSRSKEVYESLFVGTAAVPIRDVTLTDCRFRTPGGCTEQPDEPAPIQKRYPEYDRHGLSAGAVFTLDHVQGLSLVRCDMATDHADIRPTVVSFNCTGIEQSNVIREGAR